MSSLSARAIDRIDTGAIFADEDAVRLNARFRDADAQAVLTGVLLERLAGEVALVSSFGAESAVLLHMVAQIAPATPVLFLETGKHFPETLAYRASWSNASA